MRGENEGCPVIRECAAGTSPRARGKHAGVGCGQFKPRNIPACAGKTRCGFLNLFIDAEHPRVRGENQ